jgi:hypothetical protein
MRPAADALELCVAVPIALCFLAPLGCLAGGLFLGGLALAPVAAVCLLPALCCLPCALCCCGGALPTAGDESGPGLFVDRQSVFFTPYGPALVVIARGGLYDDGEVYIVNSTVFTDGAAGGGGAGGYAQGGACAPSGYAGSATTTRRGGVVITELPEEADAAAGKEKAA